MASAARNGEEVSITGLAAMPLRFPGQYADDETGFSYNYLRDYDPNLGRYVESDPIGLYGGINTYLYVDADPLALIDPTGQAPHKTGPWRDCGGGWKIRIDINEHDQGRHLHWECRSGKKKKGEMGEFGGTSHEDNWEGAPRKVRDCARKFGFQPEPKAAQSRRCDNCETAATVVVVAGTGYIIWRCVRMLPSLFPPLWETIPANAIIP